MILVVWREKCLQYKDFYTFTFYTNIYTYYINISLLHEQKPIGFVYEVVIHLFVSL